MESKSGKKKKIAQKSKNKQKVIVQVGNPPIGNPGRSPGFIDAETVLGKFANIGTTGHWTLSAEDAAKNMYLAATLDSKTYTSQYPDVYNRPTAIYQAIMEIQVPASTAAGTIGRFTAFVQPSFSGGPTAASSYPSFGPRLMATVAAAANDVYTTAANASTAASYVSFRAAETNQLLGWTQPTTATSFTGIAQELRPVSMHVWAAFVGDTLADGGNIAMAPVADCARRFFDVGASGTYSSLPLLQNWEETAKLPGAYSGPIRSGAYGYYRPQDNADPSMRSAAALRQNFSAGNLPDTVFGVLLPGLVISGNSTVTSGQNVIRLEICAVAEYITTSRLVSSVPSRVAPEEILMAAKILEGVPQCVSNDDHKRMIMEVLRRANPVVSQIFGPLSGAAQSLASWGLDRWDARLRAKGL